MKTRLIIAFCAALAAAAAARGEAANPGYSYGTVAGKDGGCLQCHADSGKVAERSRIDAVAYSGTTHARIGCPACHDSVGAGHPSPGVKSAKTGCTVCHGDIAAEYTVSIHGGITECGGCHNPHTVERGTEVSALELNRTCMKCHAELRTIASHSKWLPQADLHVRALPCTTCHTSSPDYVVMMYFVKGNPLAKDAVPVSREELERIAGGETAARLVDTDADGTVSLKELRSFNREGRKDDLRLRQILVPETVTHSFGILDNRRDCSFCHASGPQRTMGSFISLRGKDGEFTRIPVERGAVLDALFGSPDYYLTGGTRNDTLNGIGLMVVAGGLVMPVGHGFLRMLTRKNRKENRHE